jgi:hypothetical protein
VCRDDVALSRAVAGDVPASGILLRAFQPPMLGLVARKTDGWLPSLAVVSRNEMLAAQVGMTRRAFGVRGLAIEKLNCRPTQRGAAQAPRSKALAGAGNAQATGSPGRTRRRAP